MLGQRITVFLEESGRITSALTQTWRFKSFNDASHRKVDRDITFYLKQSRDGLLTFLFLGQHSKIIWGSEER